MEKHLDFQKQIHSELYFLFGEQQNFILPMGSNYYDLRK